MHFCGVSEQFGDGSQQSKLPSTHVTFRVDDDLPGISRAELEAAVLEAWKRWAAVCGITVDKHSNTKTDPVQIVTVANLGGPSGVLADQQLPFGRGTGLRMRIDSSERWVIADSPPNGTINLLAVLTHEHGHCLAMSHTPVSGDPGLMDPSYSRSIFKPQEDDIAYAQRLYGPPVLSPIPAPKDDGDLQFQVNVGGVFVSVSLDSSAAGVGVKLDIENAGRKAQLKGSKAWQ